jgi:peroxiredoxin
VGYASGVGREAPTFILTAADGNEIDLEQYRGDWFPILVFVPSVSDQAAGELARLSGAAQQLWGLRGQVIVICQRHGDVTAIAPTASEFSFPLLLDDGTIAASYGLRRANSEPQAMAFIVDRSGKIVWTGEGAEALDPAALTAAFREVVR